MMSVLYDVVKRECASGQAQGLPEAKSACLVKRFTRKQKNGQKISMKNSWNFAYRARPEVARASRSDQSGAVS